MYILVQEGTHYEFVQGPDHEHQWFTQITFGKFEGTVVSFSDIQINGKTGEMHYHLDLVEACEQIPDLTIHDDELQLVSSSIMQDILMKSVTDKSGRFIDIESGEIIGY